MFTTVHTYTCKSHIVNDIIYDIMLNTGQAAKFLNISKTTLKRWDKQNVLKPDKTTEWSRFYDEKKLRNFLNNTTLLPIKSKKHIPINKGEIFGRLKVVKRISNSGTQSRYECVCECGEKTIALAKRLRNGVTSKCRVGCKLDEGLSIFNVIYRDLKRKGRDPQNPMFFLTKERTFELFKGNCNYCKRPPQTVRVIERLNGQQFVYNGIDRVDSSRPYEEGNVVSCCATCNFMKHILTVDEFKNHIKLLYENFVQQT